MIAGWEAGSLERMQTDPRDSGRNWQTAKVSPGWRSRTRPPFAFDAEMSIEAGRIWNCRSGEARSCRDRLNAATCAAESASKPRSSGHVAHDLTNKRQPARLCVDRRHVRPQPIKHTRDVVVLQIAAHAGLGPEPRQLRGDQGGWPAQYPTAAAVEVIRSRRRRR